MKTSTRWYRTPRIVLEMGGAAGAHVDALTGKRCWWIAFLPLSRAVDPVALEPGWNPRIEIT